MARNLDHPKGVQQLAYEEYLIYCETREIPPMSFKEFLGVGDGSTFGFDQSRQGAMFWRKIQLGVYNNFTSNYPDRSLSEYSDDFNPNGDTQPSDSIKEGDDVEVSNDNKNWLTGYVFLGTDQKNWKDKYPHGVEKEGETSFWRYMRSAKPIAAPDKAVAAE